MREVEVEGHKVLLVRTAEGRYGAVGSRCTHYNAPLVKGNGGLADHRYWCVQAESEGVSFLGS